MKMWTMGAGMYWGVLGMGLTGYMRSLCGVWGLRCVCVWGGVLGVHSMVCAWLGCMGYGCVGYSVWVFRCMDWGCGALCVGSIGFAGHVVCGACGGRGMWWAGHVVGGACCVRGMLFVLYINLA